MQPDRCTKTLLCFALLFLCTTFAWAQKNSVKGIVADTSDKKKLEFAIVALIDLKDSSLYRSIRTDPEGKFELIAITPGKYQLMVSYPKMADYLQELDINANSAINLATIPMLTKAQLLQEVIVRAGVPIRMRGDTLEYTADSFAVAKGANVEELLKRLPGITVEKDGRIFAQGQEVKKMLVDGDEFFSDDPTLASKFLTAEAVDKVQVFDKKSEQSEFTGIDDGTRTKTINVKLKKNRKNGSFGKIAAGADGKDYYHNEAMAALFSGARKMSAFGVASKTGRTDLSFGELQKYVNQDYEQIDDGSGVMISRNDSYEGDTYYGNGLPTVESGGAHYSDKWNYDKQKVFANYRIKQINAAGWSDNQNTTVLPDGTGFNSFNDRTEKTYSFSQRANGSAQLALDSFSSIKISVNGGMGNNTSRNTSMGESRNEKGVLVNNSAQLSNNASFNQRFGSNIAYRRRFRREGNTLAITLQQDYSKRLNDSYDSSRNNYFDPASGIYRSADSLNQLQTSNNQFNSWAAKAQYTDKIGKYFGWSAEYGYKSSETDNMFATLNKVADKFEHRVDSLSNDYNFKVRSHITGAVLNYNTKKTTLNIGTRVFFTGLNQFNNDNQTETVRHFVNLSPQLNFNYKFSQNANLYARYTGETFQPQVEQLQPLRRSSNRLYVQEGNPDLQPGFRHSLNIGYSQYNWAKGRSFYASLYTNYEDNMITNSTTIDAQNRTVSKYINQSGIPSFNLWTNYSWQNKKAHLRTDASTQLNRRGTYLFQNNKRLKNESMGGNVAIRTTHTWEKVMNTSYRAAINFNFGRSDIPGYASQTTLAHSHTFTNNLFLPYKIEIGNDIVFSFQPKNKTFNNNLNIITWNAFAQKKFLKNDRGMVKLSVNDILNQNTGYYRNVYGNNVSEGNRLVLKRYFLLTLSWEFSKAIK